MKSYRLLDLYAIVKANSQGCLLFKLPGRHSWQPFSLPQLIQQTSARIIMG